MIEQSKAVIWDTGGILTPDGYEGIEQGIASFLHIGIKPLRTEVAKYKDEVTIGKLTLSELYKRVLSNLNLNFLPEQITKLHVRLYRKFTKFIDPDIVRLITELGDNGYRNFYLTNTEPEIYQFNVERNLWRFYPDGGIASCRGGFKKPDPEIYLAALKSLDMENTPELAVAVDDKEEYVEGAKRVGISGLWYPQFRQAEVLRERLIELGFKLK